MKLSEEIKELNKRREKVAQQAAVAKAALESKKESLKKLTEELKKLGVPDVSSQQVIASYIQKTKEVLDVKVRNYKSEIEEAEKLLSPMRLVDEDLI